MVAVPPAIIFINNDLSAQVKDWIIKQLHINFTMTGAEFDAAISANSNYPNTIRALNTRLLVIRDFRELENREHADVVVFVKSGMAAIERNKFGPPNQTFLVRNLNWGQLNIYNINQTVSTESSSSEDVIIPSVSAPVIQSATISEDGLTLTLLYNNTLNTHSVPSISVYSLLNTAVTILSTSISNFKVVLSLSTAVQYNETIFITYIASGNVVQNIFGENAENLTAYSVINNSIIDTHDVVAPIIQSAVISSNGLILTLEYDEDLDIDSVPSASDYSLFGVSSTVFSVNISGNMVILILSSIVQINETVTVSYSIGESPLQDAVGNNVAMLSNYSVTNNSTQDMVAPVIQSATVLANGLALELVYNELLNVDSVPFVDDYSLTGSSSVVDSIEINETTVTLVFINPIQFGETITVTYIANTSPVQDIAENNVLSLSNYSVINNSTTDTIEPIIQSATVPSNGLTMALIYNEALDTGSVPLANAYSLSGTSATVSSVAIVGSTVTLTFSGTVQISQIVTVTYTAGASPVQDAAGNNTENLINYSVTNNSIVDVVAPIIQSATVPSNGLTMALIYNEALDTGSVPLANAYSLSGTSATVSSVAIVGSTVTLTFSGIIQQTDTVTISYTAGASSVQDIFSNDAANLTNYSVTNNSTQDIVAPVIQSSAVPINGLTLALVYNENLDTGSVPLANAYSLSGTSATVSSVAIVGSTVTLTFSGIVQAGETVTVNYIAGISPVQDIVGNAATNLTNQPVTNNSTADTIAPVFQNAAINSAGSSLIFTYNEALNTGSTPATGDFSLVGTSAAVTVVNVTGLTVALTLSPVAQVDEIVTISYTAGTFPIEDVAGNNAANLVNQAVTNNSTQDTVAPILQTAVINSAGTSLILTYNEALNTGSTPATGDFSLVGTSAAVTVVNVTGLTVALTLSPVVQSSEIVTINYTAGASPIEDITGNNVANLVAQAITNNSTVDTVAPVLQTAVINSAGTSLILTYNEALNTGSIPVTGDFSLGGTIATVIAINVTGLTVDLTMSPPIIDDETVIISYTAGASPIEDVAGNNAANLSNQATVNNSTFLPAAPVRQSISAITVGTVVRVIYDVNLLESPLPSAGDFALVGTVAVIASVAISGANVDLTLTGVIAENDTSATLSYTPGANPIKESRGITNAASFSTQAITLTSPAVLNFSLELFVADGTWTSPARAGSAIVEGWGGGAGGIQDVRGGGGGSYARLNAFSYAASTGYAITVGAAGAVAAAGGNSTFNSTSLVAEGGGQSGTISDGGRTANSTGDIKFAGGNGGVGTGNQNGGGSGGSTSAGVLNIAGEPDGGRGSNGSASTGSKSPGGGGRSTGAAQFVGSRGLVHVLFNEISSGVYPELRKPTIGRDLSTNTTRDVTIPSGSNNELLVCFASANANVTLSMSGWTELVTTINGTTNRISVFYRTATGSDGVTLVSSLTSSVTWQVHRIRNGGTPTGSTATGTSTTANPPSISPGSNNYLLFSFASILNSTTAGNVASIPTNYEKGIIVPAPQSIATLNAVCWRTANISTEDPGTFTNDNVAWAAATVAIPRV